jgi:HSP20 family protein
VVSYLGGLPLIEEVDMAEAAPKMTVKTEEKKPDETAGRSLARAEIWPFTSLRHEIDRLFDDLQWNPWRAPFRRSLFGTDPAWRGDIGWNKVPAVDVVDTPKAYEVTAELPGLDERNVEVKFADGTLTIKGEKKDEREEKQKDYYVSERHYGSFQRLFTVPDGVDVEKIEASYKNGVLTVTLPKMPEFQKKEKKIEIKKA